MTGIDLVVPPPKQISFSRVSSRDVSKTNSSKQGSAEGWKVLRDSVAFWILKMETGPNALTNSHFSLLWYILIIQENELHEAERVMKWGKKKNPSSSWSSARSFPDIQSCSRRSAGLEQKKLGYGDLSISVSLTASDLVTFVHVAVCLPDTLQSPACIIRLTVPTLTTDSLPVRAF